MLLSRGLRIRPGQVTAFVGAGGKTRAIRRLVREVSGPVVVATTTHLGREQNDLAEIHWGYRNWQPADPEFFEGPDRLENFASALEAGRSILLTGPLTADGERWTAYPVVRGDPLLSSRGDAPLLIEADGARQRSFKAPADHEPSLPDQVEPLTVVPVAALDVLGEPVASSLVHRPERVAALLGVDQSSILGPAEIAAVLGSEAGGLKGVPDRAELRVLLTKVNTGNWPASLQIANLLLENDRIESVSIADLTAEDPVWETHARVAGIVLAAGGSSRLGEPKQLVPWRGHPLVWHAVRAALDGGLSPVVVVVGQAAERVRQALAGEPVLWIENRDWQAGQSQSVLAGMAALAEVRPVEAVVMLLADMPFVDAQLVRAVGNRYRKTGAALVAPYANGRRSNPVLFDRVTFDDLQRLEGDQGGRILFQRHPHAAIEWDDSITFDLDTPADLKRLRELE